MSDEKKISKQNLPIIPRVLADFGGRRKIFERRLKWVGFNLSERRKGEDRRSGYDRRSTLNEHGEQLPEKRKNNHNAND